jgi:Fur family ferric uptake transcriptional regulator
MLSFRNQVAFKVKSMSYQSQAEELIKKTQSRVTTARVRVLAFLLQQSRSFTHHEIEHKLGNKDPIDSVTLYRVLEWLVERELIHKIAGDDQVWRFSAGSAHASHEHAHFQCSKCTTVTCFNEIKLPRNISLPAGFSGQEVNFLIKGLCPQCG